MLCSVVMKTLVSPHTQPLHNKSFIKNIHLVKILSMQDSHNINALPIKSPARISVTLEPCFLYNRKAESDRHSLWYSLAFLGEKTRSRFVS